MDKIKWYINPPYERRRQERERIDFFSDGRVHIWAYSEAAAVRLLAQELAEQRRRYVALEKRVEDLWEER